MLSDLVNTVTQLVENIVQTFGAPGITLIALFENLFPPTPSEMLYPLAGKMAYDGKISLLAIIAAGTLGSLAGSLLYYGLGYCMSKEGARATIARFGTIRIWRLKLVLIAVEDFDRGLTLFERHGGIIVFVARLMPLVHGVVSIPAGVIHMNLFLFMAYTVLGAALWIGPLALLGYWLGNNWQDVLAWLDLYQNLLIVLLVSGVVYYVVRRGRARQTTNRNRLPPLV